MNKFGKGQLNLIPSRLQFNVVNHSVNTHKLRKVGEDPCEQCTTCKPNVLTASYRDGARNVNKDRA